jgi:hypothetical protein
MSFSSTRVKTSKKKDVWILEYGTKALSRNVITKKPLTLHNIQEDRRPQLHSGESLKATLLCLEEEAVDSSEALQDYMASRRGHGSGGQPPNQPSTDVI